MYLWTCDKKRARPARVPSQNDESHPCVTEKHYQLWDPHKALGKDTSFTGVQDDLRLFIASYKVTSVQGSIKATGIRETQPIHISS